MPTVANKLSPQEMLERARAIIVLNHPFYSVLLLNARTRITDAIPTAAASINEILVNPDFFTSLKKEESVAVLLHEVLHMALSHITRQGNRNIILVDPTGHPVTLWNIAIDMVVNQILHEGGHTLPKGCVECEENYKGWSAEQVYEDLEKKIKNNKNAKSIVLGGKWIDDHIQAETGPGGQKSGGKDGLNKKELSEGQKREEELKWQSAVEAAASAQRMSGKGDLPSAIQKILDELLNPKVHWTEILPYLLSTYIPYDYSDVSYDRRLIAHGIYTEDLSETKAQVGVGIDTSGSISDKDITQFLSEILGILQSRLVSSVRCLTADAKVHEDVEIKTAEDLPLKVSGRGGTSFIPVFERLEDKPPQLLVYLTDGMGDYPKDPPNYPVLWVLTSHVSKGDSYYPPWGHVCYIDVEE